MKNFCFILCLVFLNISAQTNTFSISYEVTRPDIELNSFAKDSTANALLIYEMGNSFVDPNSFKLNTEIKRKLKVFNRNGFEHAEISILLYDNKDGDKEKVKDINATVYNVDNGKIVKTALKKIDIFEEKYNDNYTLMKFAFPNIKEGSVINYSYTLESPFMYKYKSWNFQDEIPKLYSEYNTSIPGNWEYNIKLVGGKKLTTNEIKIKKRCLEAGNANADCSISKYVMVDIPAFIDEDYMTTRTNYLARIEYELKTFRNFTGDVNNYTKSWKNTDNEIKKDTDLGRQLNQQNKVKDLLPDAISSIDNPIEKAKSILNYVQNNYIWNETFNLFQHVSIKDLIKNKTGSVGDINTLLYLLLKEHDIEVKPLILSTRNNGLVTKIYPVLSDFNYLIVKADIDGQTYLLDGTEDYFTFGQIPFRCLNQYGRLLDFKNGSSWYPIEIKDPSLIVYSSELNLDSNQVLHGKVDYMSTGYHSLGTRKAYFSNSESFIDDYKNEHSSLNISDFKVFDTEQTGDDFNASFTIEASPDVVGETVYLNPFLFKFFEDNPFKLQQRSYPIDFGYKDAFIYKFKINVDDSYTITEIPEPTNLKLPGNKGSFLFSAQQNENSVTMYFKLSFNEPIYDSVFYDGLKTIMTKVVDIQSNSLIVLEKKE
ncbi:DUF3857 domain-containing protein [Psychroserpens sp.]|uniref:DUF3857 domain-containing protein n=1 Tax=Psychroserpens sp. TaxID=2020870 RepID=UPI002B278EA6|nr:DUF3857 domain-containing protein [Psychroserpens sp.]